jgi:hypothetical protein
MKKYLLLIIGTLFLTAAFSFREWLLWQEAAVTKNQLKDQATQSIQNAQTFERVHYFTTSTVVYERYLEPVIEIANRLLWSPSRSEIISDWKREIHALLDDLAANRTAALSLDAEKNIQKLRADSKPSLNRLYEVLKNSENNTTLSCAQTVHDEMKMIAEAGQKRDQEILTQMKVEGLTQLKHLDKAMKGMTNAQVGNFLKSGRFIREIQQPVFDLALQIKQEELRKSAWAEFERKLSSALSKKGGTPVANVKDRSLRAKKEIEKLFNSMAEAKTLEVPELPHEEKIVPPSTPRTPAAPETSRPLEPTEESFGTAADLPEGELTSPSDASTPAISAH